MKHIAGSAFPTETHQYQFGNEGMTLRDYFAAHAITGVMLDGPKRLNNAEIAEFSYCVADAMLAERSKE